MNFMAAIVQTGETGMPHRPIQWATLPKPSIAWYQETSARHALSNAFALLSAATCSFALLSARYLSTRSFSALLPMQVTCGLLTIGLGITAIALRSLKMHLQDALIRRERRDVLKSEVENGHNLPNYIELQTFQRDGIITKGEVQDLLSLHIGKLTDFSSIQSFGFMFHGLARAYTALDVTNRAVLKKKYVAFLLSYVGNSYYPPRVNDGKYLYSLDNSKALGISHNDLAPLVLKDFEMKDCKDPSKMAFTYAELEKGHGPEAILAAVECYPGHLHLFQERFLELPFLEILKRKDEQKALKITLSMLKAPAQTHWKALPFADILKDQDVCNHFIECIRKLFRSTEMAVWTKKFVDETQGLSMKELFTMADTRLFEFKILSKDTVLANGKTIQACLTEELQALTSLDELTEYPDTFFFLENTLNTKRIYTCVDDYNLCPTQNEIIKPHVTAFLIKHISYLLDPNGQKTEKSPNFKALVKKIYVDQLLTETQKEKLQATQAAIQTLRVQRNAAVSPGKSDQEKQKIDDDFAAQIQAITQQCCQELAIAE